MRQTILFILLFIGFHSAAEISDRAAISYYKVDSVTPYSTLNSGKSEVVVFVLNEEINESEKILYGYDDESLKAVLNAQKSFKFQLDSGEHVFQFYPAKEKKYLEITTDPIPVKAGTTTYLSISFWKIPPEEKEILHVRKPVIYLYPTEKTNVSVAVKSKGDLSFTYPAYKDKWECTASPSGELIIDDSNGNRNAYNYLFWEAEQTIEPTELNESSGMVVTQENLMPFLESSLDKFGFTSKEKMDFITYWAPQMIQHEATEIRFMFNEECNFFADLEIEPKPENLLRFYIIWNPIDLFYLDENKKIEVPASNRSGFTVLEWGGMEIPRGDRPE